MTNGKFGDCIREKCRGAPRVDPRFEEALEGTHLVGTATRTVDLTHMRDRRLREALTPARGVKPCLS